jgi:hypothetical protein
MTIACQNEAKVADELEQAEETEEIEEIEITPFSQDDFVLRIDTLPYRGAVLFIDYNGEIDISEFELRVEIATNDVVMQENMPTEEVDGYLIAEIIDLMYLPGDALEFILKIKVEENVIFETYHSEQLQRYPWKDWMLADGEWSSVTAYSPNFTYYRPNCPNNLGAHSSWDIMTTTGKAVKVYSGTIGVITRSPTFTDVNLEIYNPYIGAIVQYAHVTPAGGYYNEKIRVGKMVYPGEYVADVIPKDKHIHYTIIRPYKYALHTKEGAWKNFYWAVTTENGKRIQHDNYNDPFYFHEPTTLGYWYEETLPPGLKSEMLNLFKKNNPGVVLPATKPLEAD